MHFPIHRAITQSDCICINTLYRNIYMYSTYLFYFTNAISLLLTLYTNGYNKMYALFMFAFYYNILHQRYSIFKTIMYKTENNIVRNSFQGS